MRRLSDRWWLVGIVLTCAALAAFGSLLHAAQARRSDQRRTASAAAVSALRSQVNGVLAQETALARVVGVLRTPIGDRWPQLAGTVMDQPLAASTGYVEIVRDADRAAFEQRLGHWITRFVGPGDVEVAPTRRDYYVLSHLSQRPTIHITTGLDLAADPVRRRLLRRSARSDRQLATGPITFLSDQQTRGVVVYEPVHGRDGRMDGWIATTYAARQLAHSVEERMPGLRLTIRDGDSVLVDGHAPRAGAPVRIAVAGRTWQVWATPASTSLGPTPWLVLGLGLVLTAGVTLLLRGSVVRERYASAEVDRHLVAERHQQEQLAAERRALAEAQTIARIGSWRHDRTGDHAEWSAEMYRVFDRDPSDGPVVLGAFLELLHEDDRERFADAWRTAVRGGHDFDLYVRLRPPGGTVRHLHAIGRREDDGSYSGTVQDITAAAELREELRAVNATLSAVLEHAPMGIYMRDLEGRWVIANQEVATIGGRDDVSEVIGRHSSELATPEVAAHIEAVDRRIIATGEAMSEDMGMAGIDPGSLSRYWIQRFPVRDADGEIIGVGGLALDMTERIETEEALRATEERFRGAFEGSPVGMVIMDFDGRLLQVNDSLCEILGYSRDQLEGAFAGALAHADDAAETRAVMADMRDGLRDAYAAEKQYRTGSGEIVDCALNATVLRDREGRPTAVLSQLQDVTDRNRNQRRLEELADRDPLTGLLNRRAFERELAAHEKRCDRYGASGSVLLIDLDGLKAVNDSLGHRAGDELIATFGRRLDERLRASDVIARIGGDEFVVLLPGADGEAARAVAESLLDGLRAQAVTLVGRPHHASASIGIASFVADPGLSADGVMVAADAAMYAAKRAGAGRVCVAGDPRPRADILGV